MKVWLRLSIGGDQTTLFVKKAGNGGILSEDRFGGRTQLTFVAGLELVLMVHLNKSFWFLRF